MPELAALPLEVRIPRPKFQPWPLWVAVSVYGACSRFVCLSSNLKTYLHCRVNTLCQSDTSFLSAVQVLANVVAKLPLCEAIQLQRVSQ